MFPSHDHRGDGGALKLGGSSYSFDNAVTTTFAGTASFAGSITSNPASGANILFQNGSGTAVGRITFDSTNLKLRGDSSKGLKLGSNGSDVIEIDTSSISTFSGDIRISSGNALYRDSTNSSTVLAGGNADNAGGNIILRGQSHSTEANFLKFRNGTTNALVIDGSGNVGIGTTPSYILDVTGASANVGKFKRSSAGTTEVLIDTSGSGDAQLVFADNGTDSWAIGRDNTNGDFVIAASGALGTSNAINIESGGNVGIGTTSPVATLQIKTQADGNAAFQNSTSLAGGVKINAFNDAASASVPFEIDGSSLQFNIAAVEKMRIDSSGNVGISTTSAKEKLDSRGAAVFSGDNSTGTNAFGTSAGLLLSTASDNSAARITAVSNGANNRNLELRTLSSGSASTALTLDSSQNATFAGEFVLLEQGAGTLPSSTNNGLIVQHNANVGDNAHLTLIGGNLGDSRIEFGDDGDRDIGMIRS
jgi:hypothetical protein